MRYLKVLLVGLLLAVPAHAAADADDIPGAAVWYFHVDLEQMRADGPGKGVYAWLQDEAFSDVKQDAGIDLDKELDRLTAFSLPGVGPVIVVDGNFSQETRDKIMTFIAAGGDLEPRKASGKTYFHFAGGDNERGVEYTGDHAEFDIESLEEDAWVSMAVDRKLLITGSEEQMHAMLADNGRIAGSRSYNGALLVLTAEKTMLQAGMNSAALGDNSGSDWNSNILRNTEQVAFLMAAAANKLALEAKLVTSAPEMAESLASVARGLISLVAFNDDMDAEAIAMLQGTKVEASGNTLSLSLAVDPDLVVRTLSE